MSIEKKWAYVFTQSCGLEKVALKPDMVIGQEVCLPSTQTRQTMSLQRFKPVWAAAGFLLVLVMVLSLLVGTGAFLSPVYATISVDVNP
ncbi:MAG: anti-sigma factor domain-containing protein, partial [Bacillota bacterium]|nr:anti-sigma factor domain-containing protein [Bacillota bacterium]